MRAILAGLRFTVMLERTLYAIVLTLAMIACTDDALDDEDCPCGPSIQMTILDAQTGERVANALAQTEGGACTTGASGDVCMLDVGGSSHEITITAPGYEERTVEVTVSDIDEPGCSCSIAISYPTVELTPSP